MKKEDMKSYLVDAAGATSDLKRFSQVRADVVAYVAQSGGEMLKDASGFGVPNHPDAHSHLMLVKLPDDAVAGLRQIPGVELVAENKRHVVKHPDVRRRPGGPRQ